MKTIVSLKREHYLVRVSICLLAAALIVGLIGCEEGHPATVEIWDWNDLNTIRDNLGANHLLMNDIDSTTDGYEEFASDTANDGKGWQPIGNYEAPFTGTFDGQGYEISNIHLGRPNEYHVGLFGYVAEGATINNVGILAAYVTGGNSVGILAGTNQGTVRNSYSDGSVTGSEDVGGLVGGNGGSVSDSYSNGNVSGVDLVGGLVGGSTDTVRDCHSGGSVSGESRVGGLVGGMNGIVSNSYSSANVIGDIHIGGLVGYANEGTVSNCHSTGSAIGDSYVGGLVGWNRDTIRDCYSLANVTGEWLVGGLVGHNRGTVSDSYSSGSVCGNEDIGGLIGRNYQGSVSDSCWDTETSGQSISDGGTGKSTAEMKDIGTFVGWDIIAVTAGETNTAYTWNIVNAVTYPFLSWQP
jgi:hypothetical protein